MTNKFKCDCGGAVKQIADDEVLHACARKYAAGTSYYDGVDRFIPHKRTQINPSLTNGEIKYRWYVDWQ